MIDKYRAVVSKQTSFPEMLDKIINTYNNQPHRTIKSTPNEMFNDVSKQNFNYDNDREFNRNVLKKNNITIGAEVRILESKGKLEKGSQKYSTDLYKLVERDGNRFIVQDSEGDMLRSKLNTSEMAERQGQRGGSFLASKVFDIGKQNTKFLNRTIPKGPPIPPGWQSVKPPSGKVIKGIENVGKTFSSVKAFTKVAGPLALGLTAFQVATAKNAEEASGAIGGMIGSTIGAAVGTAFGPIGTVVGGMLGSFVGDVVGSAIGRKIDMYTETNKTAEERGKMAQESLSKNMEGIFAAFKIGRFDLITKQLGLAFENLYLQLKQKVVRIFSLGTVGNDSEEGQNTAKVILDRFQKQTANITDEGTMKTYFEQAKKQIEGIDENSTVGNQMYINMLETQMESQKLQTVVAQEALKEQKKGNKISEQIRDKEAPTSTNQVERFINDSGGINQLPIFSQ
jgi:3D (Asp-Asp-Asp) domain-containing protein